jgi:peroxiredoxin
MLRILLLILALAAAGAAQAQARVGEPVPDFDTRLLDGKSLPAAALKGKAVLVVFWATWCPSCQRELPELQKLYEKYRSRGFEILALSVDADAFTVEEFWKDHDYGFPVAMRAPQHARAFGGIRATPTLFILDRQGVLRMAHIGALGLQKLEAKLLPLL